MYTVYSMEGCQACVKATNLLKSKELEFKVVKIDEDLEAGAWIMSQGHRSMPQIYVDGVLLPGGFVGLQKQFA